MKNRSLKDDYHRSGEQATGDWHVIPTNVAVELLAFLVRFGISQVQISAQRPAILTEILCGFPQSPQANAGTVP
jgi:hypothetical protein